MVVDLMQKEDSQRYSTLTSRHLSAPPASKTGIAALNTELSKVCGAPATALHPNPGRRMSAAGRHRIVAVSRRAHAFSGYLGGI
jgi:hypothetical protein